MSSADIFLPTGLGYSDGSHSVIGRVLNAEVSFLPIDRANGCCQLKPRIRLQEVAPRTSGESLFGPTLTIIADKIIPVLNLEPRTVLAFTNVVSVFQFGNDAF